MEKDCDEIEFRYFLDTYQISKMVKLKMMDFVCRKVRKSVKINQIPGQWILGRKDHFTRIYNEKRSRYKHLNFYPNTFVLPEDSERLLTFMSPEKLVLVKPPNWFSGLGIKLTNKLGEIWKNKLALLWGEAQLSFPYVHLKKEEYRNKKGDL